MQGVLSPVIPLCLTPYPFGVILPSVSEGVRTSYSLLTPMPFGHGYARGKQRGKEDAQPQETAG